MGKFNTCKKPFESKKKNRGRKKINKEFAKCLKEKLTDYNKASWFNQVNLLMGDDDEDLGASASARKIILPEEDIEAVSDNDDYDSDESEDNDAEERNSPNRLLIIDTILLETAIQKFLSCKFCKGEVKLQENCSSKQGLGTKLFFECKNRNCASRAFDRGFYTTKKTEGKKSFQINITTTLAFRSIGKGRSAAVKMLSVMNTGVPVCRSSWRCNTEILNVKIATVAEKNMKESVDELKQLALHNSSDIMRVGVSFDASWNSQGWQAKEGIVAAINQDYGKIIDVIHKTSSCSECKTKQNKRDEGTISSLEFMEWYIEHEPTCLVNHTGSPQVNWLLTVTPTYSQGFLCFWI